MVQNANERERVIKLCKQQNPETKRNEAEQRNAVTERPTSPRPTECAEVIIMGDDFLLR